MAKLQSSSSQCDEPVPGMQWPISYVVPLRPEFSFSTAVPPQNVVFQEFLGGTLPKYDDVAPNPNPTSSSCNQAATSMTIFYSGAVHLFHDISPEKAKLIMEMARQGKTDTIIETINTQNKQEQILGQKSQQNLAPFPTTFTDFYAKGALAMARKATLARFLEKRKHRLIYAANPYRHVDKSINFSPQAPKNTLEFKIMLQEEEQTSSSGVDLESRCSTSIK